jgi:hypothetical protein
MSSAVLADQTVTECTLQIPSWGRAWADVEIAEAVELTGQQTLKIADASYVMTIMSGGVTDAGRARYRLVAGAGKWGDDIPKQSYANDALITASLAVRDAATACGEPIGTLPSGNVGPHFARRAGPACDALNLVAPRGWYVDAAGVTQCAARPSTIYTGDGTRVRRDPSLGVIELAVDELGTLAAPGVSIDGSAPASDIEIEVDPTRITVRAYTRSARAERFQHYTDIFESLFPWLRYVGLHEYRVVRQIGDRLNLQPARVAYGLPELARVPVRGPAGIKAQVALGELVLVAFADPQSSGSGRPNVVAHAAAGSAGWMPLTLDIGDGPVLGIARMTDPVQAGPFSGAIVGASLRNRAGL